MVPNFINTPLDVLALGLFDLMVPLALKVASARRRASTRMRRRQLVDYLVGEWGYDAEPSSMPVCGHLEVASRRRLGTQLAQTLAEFASQNRIAIFR